MKRVFFVIIAWALISSGGYSQFNLRVEITGIRNNTGTIMLQLFDENEKVLTQLMGEIKGRCG